MIRSRAGSRPVISRSIQTRLWSSVVSAVSVVMQGSRHKFSQHSWARARTYTAAMSFLAWTTVFAAALVASLAIRAWLLARQVRHVAQHRDEVPAAFRSSVDLAAHRR